MHIPQKINYQFKFDTLRIRGITDYLYQDINPFSFNLTARNSPTSKVAGCKGFGLVQGLTPCA